MGGYKKLISILKSCEKAGEVYTWMRYRFKENQPVFMSFGFAVSVFAVVLCLFPFASIFPADFAARWIVIILGTNSCILMLLGWRSEPGVVPAGTVSAKDLLNFDQRRRNVCYTCMAEKPLRSKHSSISNRCIERFDHYCAWINNDVGLKNHRIFYAYLVSVLPPLWAMVYFSVMFPFTYIPAEEVNSARYFHTMFVGHTWIVLLFILYVAFAIFVTILLFDHTKMMVTNSNTNESINWHRYDLFKDHLGKYHNPFDR
uniref:Palmitoyltransferase n=4 Tax=Palpitomonas bilix TaxID=652834 RepID=A0A7S3GG01_9EUKA|mmetsp:Transcript_47719/g.123741  ORF Transcript_47719/g.123741 Transcript_47719/m.123741 type:complete len:258 (+) Transcript_47719:459-1232(+)